MTRRQLLGYLATVSVICSGCASTPLTSRRQLMFLSPDAEARLGLQAYRDFLSAVRQRGRRTIERGSSPEADRMHERVSEVFSRVVKASGWDRRYQWEHTIIDEPKTINAGIYPGGKMVMFSGMLNFAESDDKLAAVIGHEVGHAIARHGGERFSQVMAAQLTETSLGLALASSRSAPYVHAAFGLGVTFGVLLPYSRLHETEADYIGLILAAKGGYDPRAAVELWERMEREKGSRTPEFMSTHPAPGTRARQLTKWMPEALQYRHDPYRPLPLGLPGS